MTDQAGLDERAVRLRAAGWRVAVHNDYRLAGEDHTFWLWTHPDGRYVKGEGRTDNEALEACTKAAFSGQQPAEGAFQARVQPWMMECFGAEIAADKLERNDRFIEEALELVQACGYEQERAHALVDYVFGRPTGEPHQEVGGVMVTLAALCLAHGLDMHAAAEDELARINAPKIIAKIRAKQAAKPTGSALPITTPPPVPDRQDVEATIAAGRSYLKNCGYNLESDGLCAADIDRGTADNGWRMAAFKAGWEASIQSRPSYEEGVRAEVVEEEISAWAFAHNVDGAIRNDLMRRIRERLALLPPPLTEDQSHEG